VLDQEVVPDTRVNVCECRGGSCGGRAHHVALAGISATGWLLLSVSCVRLEPQLISAFTCEGKGVGGEMEIRLRWNRRRVGLRAATTIEGGGGGGWNLTTQRVKSCVPLLQRAT
jgi:hypothetical protein